MQGIVQDTLPTLSQLNLTITPQCGYCFSCFPNKAAKVLGNEIAFLNQCDQ